MKTKNILYTLCIAVCMIAPFVISTVKAASVRPATKDVNVYWIHGLYEDALFWKDFCEEITPGNGICLEYDSDHPEGAAGIAAELNGLISDDKEAVLIGHSAGGLIARSIMNMNSNVTAVITVGTPNKGAGIVASVRSEGYMSIVNQIMNNANSALDNAEYAMDEAQQFLFWQWAPELREAINDAAIVRVLNDLIDNIDKSEISKWVDENYNSRLFYDMDSNSNYLRTLNNYSLRSGQKLYCIDGQEDKGQLYRLLGTAANMDRIKGSGSRTTYDTELIKNGGAVYELLAYIQEGIDACNMARDEIWCHTGHIGRAYNALGTAIHDLEYLRNYLDTYIHSDWSDEIGAYHYERQLVTIPTIGGSGGLISGGTDGGYNGGNSGNGGGTNVEVGVEYTQEWRTIKISDPHDGLIGLPASQIHDTDGSNCYRTDVTGVNHMEMGSHQAMLDAIEEAFSNSIRKTPIAILDTTIKVAP